MQTYPLSLTAANPATVINIEGRGFWYVSGASTGSNYIIVKPENGNEMELKPGQSFKLTEDVGRWYVRSKDGVSAITATLNIGSGEFNDSANTVALDATFANNVTVQNPASNPVNVKSLVQAMDYTNSFSSNTGVNTALQVVAAAANVNGVDLKQFSIISTTLPGDTGGIYLLAKATQPASVTDGDMIDVIPFDNSLFAKKSIPNIRVAAGKAVWLMSANNPVANTAITKSILYSIL